MPYLKDIYLRISKNQLTKKFGVKITLLFLTIVVFVLIFLIYQGYQYYKRQTILSSLENPSTINLQEYEKDEILKEINELFSLGENQEAVIGKIVNVDRLSSQHRFFQKAKNGQYLLVMPEFTLIYDRENKQVVDIARENLLDLKERE